MALICLLALLSLVLQPFYCTSKCQSCLQLCPFTHFIDITFTVDPVSINTTLNSTVIFTCNATDTDYLTFRVNNKSAYDREVLDKGFIQLTSGFYGTRTGILQAIAYDFNNNTIITCRASTDKPPAVYYSKPALLLIQGSECLFRQSSLFRPYIGLLASVGNLTVEYFNESSVLLSWTAPYTLDNVPITGYYINDASGRILNTTDLSLLFSDICDMTNVTLTVSAVNGAGIGQPASTSFYYERGIISCIVCIQTNE